MLLHERSSLFTSYTLFRLTKFHSLRPIWVVLLWLSSTGGLSSTSETVRSRLCFRLSVLPFLYVTKHVTLILAISHASRSSDVTRAISELRLFRYSQSVGAKLGTRKDGTSVKESVWLLWGFQISRIFQFYEFKNLSCGLSNLRRKAKGPGAGFIKHT